jgi:hypothetical protein
LPKPPAFILGSYQRSPSVKLAEETRSFLERDNVPVLALTIYQRAAYNHALLVDLSMYMSRMEKRRQK